MDAGFCVEADAGFCVEALNEALAEYGQPEIFNTDQGSQFTSVDFTGVLKDAGVANGCGGRRNTRLSICTN
jgi:putative transposase